MNARRTTHSAHSSPPRPLMPGEGSSWRIRRSATPLPPRLMDWRRETSTERWLDLLGGFGGIVVCLLGLMHLYGVVMEGPAPADPDDGTPNRYVLSDTAAILFVALMLWCRQLLVRMIRYARLMRIRRKRLAYRG